MLFSDRQLDVDWVLMMDTESNGILAGIADWQPESFADYAEDRDISEDDFPGAKLGLSLMGVWRGLLLAFVIVVVINRLLYGLASFSVANEEGADVTSVMYQVTSGMSSFAVTSVSVTSLIVKLLKFALIGVSVAYVATLFYRWHNYEQNCLLNDAAALHLRATLIRNMGLRHRRSEFQRKAHHEMSGSGVKSELAGGMQYTDAQKLEALNFAMQMKVYINTREALSGDGKVYRFYHVVFNMPSDDDARTELQNVIKEFDKIATNATSGKVAFGSQMMSEDGWRAEYAGSVSVRNKYSFQTETDTGIEKTGDFESTFNADELFVNRQAEIDKKARASKRWGNQTATDLDKLLATVDARATRYDMTIGATNMEVTYKMAFTINKNNQNSLPDMLDKRFNTTGTTVEGTGNMTSITIPLPEAIQKPINAPSIYHEVYG